MSVLRIVAVADTHGHQTDLGPIPEGDVFVHAGDLTRTGSLDELAPVADWIASLPHRHKIVIAGNHDWCFARDPEAARARLGPGVVYLEDEPATVAGLSVYGSPWQPEFHGWAFNLPRGRALAEKWARIPEGLDLLITHGPPSGLGDRAWDGRATGCEDLLAALERVRPRAHLYGHIHEDGGAWRCGSTLCMNVTIAEGMRAASVLDIGPASAEPIIVPPSGFDLPALA